jgi:hypothetical protein
MPSETFELTYATMFNPPESLHTSYSKNLSAAACLYKAFKIKLWMEQSIDL